MIQGTTSDAGKSLLVTALGRWLWRRQLSVAPFKPQNMSLNSAVTPEGGEIGRAQALQAQACGLAPHVDMNPVLLKPCSHQGCQVIVLGKVNTHINAEPYQTYKKDLMPEVVAAHDRLAARHAFILVEGAGSPAEINLRSNDIANMGFASVVDCPVILVADIDRGGVFAHIIGTLALLQPEERARVRGFVINRFRGDMTLLEPGLKWLEKETGLPVIGVLPFIPHLNLDAEDRLPSYAPTLGSFHVVIPALPHMSNATDFDALRLHDGLRLTFVSGDQPIPPADLICLPGSKTVVHDLAWLRHHGWPSALARHLRYGGKIIGICGGYQMLGRNIHDPMGIESSPGSTAGLNLLDMDTTFGREKSLRLRAGHCHWDPTALVRGYEIHAGQSMGHALRQPAFLLREHSDPQPPDQPEGAQSDDGLILGTYLHGLFDQPEGCRAILTWAGNKGIDLVCARDAQRENDLDRLADVVAKHLDIALLDQLLGIIPQS